MVLPDVLASVIALVGLCAVLIMAFGERREGRFGFLGLILFGLALVLVLGMLLTRSG